MRGREGKERRLCVGDVKNSYVYLTISLQKPYAQCVDDKIFLFESTELLTLYLMTFQVLSLSSLVSGETYIPFNSFMCGEL